MTTVRQALYAMLGRCDGARMLDGMGFNKFDSLFARSLADQPEWTPSQEQAVFKMLRKYQGQLAGMGIVYFDLKRETDKAETEETPQRPTQQAKGYRKPTKPYVLEYVDSVFRIHSAIEWSDNARALKAKAGTGKFVRTESARYWEYKATAKFALAIKEFMADLAPAPGVSEKMMELVAQETREREAEELRFKSEKALIDELKLVPIDQLTVKLPVRYDRLIGGKPFDHQVRGFHIGICLDHSAMHMEQGTGKTLVGIAVSGYRFLKKQIRKVLVVAPNTVCGNWANEFETFADFPINCLMVADMKRAKREAALETLAANTDSSKLQIVIVNYESIWEKDEEDRVRPRADLMKWAPDMVILDESQKVKNGRANQSRAAHKLGDQAKYRMILTGTPVSQGPLDQFSQFRFADPRIFGYSYVKVRNRYAVMGGYMGKQIVGYRVGKTLPDMRTPNPYYDKAISDEFLQKIHSIAYRVTKAEALDLPDTVDQVLNVPMDSDQAKLYAQMEHQMMVELSETDKLTAPIVLTQMLRLQQITGGFVPTEDGGFRQVGSAKLKAVEELLEDAPVSKKFVIVCRFVPEVEAVAQVARKLGRKALTLTGETKNRTQLISQFQNDPSVTVFVVQIQTGGVGITLTASDTMIIYSGSFSYNDYDQVKARIHRIGQRNTCTYIHLVVPNSIDVDVLKALQSKGDMAKMVIDILGKVKGGTGMNGLQEKLTALKLEIEKSAGNPEPDQKEMPRPQPQPWVDFSGVQKPSKEPPKAPKTPAQGGTPNVPRKAPVDGPVVTIKDLADELDMEPKKLRKELRKSMTEKPGGRWEWAADDPQLAEIRAKFKKKG